MADRPVVPLLDGDDVEARRQAALRAYGLLDEDHPSRSDLRSLVTLAAASSGVPMAVINLLTEDEQHQIESVGFVGGVSPRSDSMCAVVVDEPVPVVLADAREDARFRDNPWVVGPASVRFYATFQLHTPAKVPIGSLCLFDTTPRALDAAAGEILQLLAARVTDVLELELRGRQWRATARELERANTRLSDFAATVSHDLRGPLSTVRFALDMLEERESGPSGGAFSTRDLLARAQRSTVRMTETIDHLLEDSQATSPDQMSIVSWRQVAEDAVEDLGHELAEVRVRLDPTDALVRCRPVGLRLALQNLLSNAARYAGPVDPRVEVRWQRADLRSEILIIDHGPGVSSEDREHIFRSGERGGARDEVEATDGYGIGLATSQRLVAEMGGILELRETPGGGATFAICLPQH